MPAPSEAAGWTTLVGWTDLADSDSLTAIFPSPASASTSSSRALEYILASGSRPIRPYDLGYTEMFGLRLWLYAQPHRIDLLLSSFSPLEDIELPTVQEI